MTSTRPTWLTSGRLRICSEELGWGRVRAYRGRSTLSSYVLWLVISVEIFIIGSSTSTGERQDVIVGEAEPHDVRHSIDVWDGSDESSRVGWW